MELTGILMGLGTVASGLQGDVEAPYPGDSIEVVSDSQYALGVGSGRFNATSNRDLVDAIADEVRRLREASVDVIWAWTRGHAGEPWNERVDRLATRAKARQSAAAQIDFAEDL